MVKSQTVLQNIT